MSQLLYTTLDSVKVRLETKVQFQSGKVPADGEVSNDLLMQMIQDAEADVELALRTRYAVPFRSKLKGTFAALPDHTKRQIRKLVDYRAVILILSTDFGRGSHTDGDPFKASFEKLYKNAVGEVLGRDMIGANSDVKRFKYSPPLEDLLLAPTNREADDGYRGMIINTDDSRCNAEAYAEDQLNNPAQSWARTRNGGL